MRNFFDLVCKGVFDKKTLLLAKQILVQLKFRQKIGICPKCKKDPIITETNINFNVNACDLRIKIMEKFQQMSPRFLVAILFGFLFLPILIAGAIVFTNELPISVDWMPTRKLWLRG